MKSPKLNSLIDTYNSPQGDGNHVWVSVELRAFFQIDTYNSPQGDGNDLVKTYCGKRVLWTIDTYNSPQGDGNSGGQKDRSARKSRDRYLQFPARGRKRFKSQVFFLPIIYIDRYLQFPARGRKRPVLVSQQSLKALIDTYNSPQGDGNKQKINVLKNLIY